MSPRDPDATRARIFEAATAEFAEYGIAGARVDRIARNAKANKQLIYAYFGDKQQLFHQVLEHAMLELVNAVTDTIEDLDRWIDEHIDYHSAHPELLRLLMWEALELGDQPTAGELRAARYAAKRHWIAVAQDKGLIRSDMPPGQILLSIMSVINYPFAVPQLRVFTLGGHPDPAEQRAWVKDAIRRIVAPQPPENSAT
ncbi:TetR family transcriptional regulator [Nocardia sp. 2]|uniref:TetR family transcriptional regulator n=1 Tax=Nocardia acididurans TaxID=2802282 RepID=A0ABS1M431_9NOCA|nr:TetR family transcriptional regulator [Nocardia acididurans]MBL1074944.1 TetR family transcriptional regulator [Nocardia acididurans]